MPSSSSASRPEPVLLFRDDCWLPVEELAARLEGTGKALAAILMACDLVRHTRRAGERSHQPLVQ